MIALVEQKKDEIAAHCRRLDVRKLEVFGSAATGTFDSETSDLDFIVEFNDWENIERADRYFALIKGLEAIFSKKVDLLVNKPFRNPYFRASVEKEREVVYAT